MKTWHQLPTDPAFVQNPYPAYRTARAAAAVQAWPDYKMTAVFNYALVSQILKDRRFGREPLDPIKFAPHLAPFVAIEAHSMLELEPPRHTRLRSLVLRAFTSRRIKELAPEIDALCDDLLDTIPLDQPFDLIKHYATPIPVIIICRLLGVPETMATQLLSWSNDMVAMYQARRDRMIEERAAHASTEFADFIRRFAEEKRLKPADDLITQLLNAEENGDKLSMDELITTCILLLNAGHEATVHTIGNGVKTLLETHTPRDALADGAIDQTVEEILRFDPPLHVFTRYCYEDLEIEGHSFERGDEVALMLAAANRDPDHWPYPDHFDPTRKIQTNTSFGGGLHFCVGAPLARLELRVALPKLLNRLPRLHIVEPPKYANLYHFHGLERLMLATHG
ncbi:cytochrome P450 [Planktotalea sp.]|uniref:cytochrome P450 n=1 Tax=Planktotalea sp. TaxID=2029877 RepID=UPI003F6CA05E